VIFVTGCRYQRGRSPRRSKLRYSSLHDNRS